MKIRIARALTKPTMTLRGMNRMSFATPSEAEDDLEDAGEDDRGDEVVHPVLARDRGDDERDRAGGGGDHRGPAAEERDRDRHHERREQPDPGVDAGDDRERDRLGDERERDDEAGEDLAGQEAGVLEGVEDGGPVGGAGACGHGCC